MIDITTGQRTFFLALSATTVTTTSNISIPFRDTSGNIIKCNYFKVDAALGRVDRVGLVLVEPSGIPVTRLHTNMPTVSAIYATTAIPTSGSLGGGVILGGGSTGSYEWHAPNSDYCTGLNFKLVSQDNTVLLGITYGNLMPFNVLRANSYSNAYDVGR